MTSDPAFPEIRRSARPDPQSTRTLPMTQPFRRLVPACLALTPAVAFAHPGIFPHEHGGFLTGVLHPLTGADHVAAIVAVGPWAAALGGITPNAPGPRRWRAPGGRYRSRRGPWRQRRYHPFAPVARPLPGNRTPGAAGTPRMPPPPPPPASSKSRRRAASWPATLPNRSSPLRQTGSSPPRSVIAPVTQWWKRHADGCIVV